MYMIPGKRRVLDTTTEFIAIRKDRCTFPIKLTVSHLAGVGEDSMFMGVILVRQAFKPAETITLSYCSVQIQTYRNIFCLHWVLKFLFIFIAACPGREGPGQGVGARQRPDLQC